MPCSKSHLSLISSLLLSKTKPHGRFKPRRQLRLFAVLGFVFVGRSFRARRLRFSPSPPRRRGLQFVRDDFFMPRSSRAFFSRIMLQMPPRCFLPQRHFSLLGLLYALSCPGNRSICIRVLRTGHSFIDCFRQRFGIERLLFCLSRKPN